MTSDQGPNEPRLEPRLDGGGSEPLNVDPYERPSPDPRRTTRKRVLAAIVALVAFGGFAGIAWYATSTGQNNPSAVVPVITADNAPVKERPANPGGLDVPNRDMKVFNEITPSSEPQKVEQLLPPAEHPVARPEAEPAPPSGPKVPDAPAIQGRGTASSTPQTVTEAPVKPAVQPKEAPPALKAPAMTETKPAPAPQKVAKAETGTAKSTASGDWRVQVGASRDEKRARAALARIVKANSDLLGKLPTDVVRADLGSKGVYYRMRAGFFASRADANTLCGKLKARKVGCAPVKR